MWLLPRARLSARMCDTARQPDGFAEAAVRLSEHRKTPPGPVEEFLFFDRPSG